MKRANVIIIHYTYGWTQDLLESWSNHLKNEKLIVFNNNPCFEQSVNYTRGLCGKDKHVNTLCQKEIFYVNNNKFVEAVVDLPNSKHDSVQRLLTHGECLDFIFNWCKNNNFDQILHLEPDCCLSGTNWLNSMIETMKDNWVVGTGKIKFDRDDYVMPLCPTLWNVSAVVDLMSKYNVSFEKNKLLHTNTAQEIIKKCLNYKKCDTVGFVKDFIHFYDGSKMSHKNNKISLL